MSDSTLVKLDCGAEVRPLERYMPRGKGEWYEVDCPFCETNQLVQTRNFHKGVRCHNPDCRAMLYFPTHDATRDMLPKNQTVIWHGLRIGLAACVTEGPHGGGPAGLGCRDGDRKEAR